jgi:hypothetical protein
VALRARTPGAESHQEIPCDCEIPESVIQGVEVPGSDISIPSDKYPPCGADGIRLLWSIGVGERRNVAEQREMLESGWVSQADANYPPATEAESTGKASAARTGLCKDSAFVSIYS